MAKIFTNSNVQPVYYQMGKDATSGKMLYRRAPFDVVLINGKLHMQPRSIGPSDQAITQFAQGSTTDQDNWRDGDMGGYETLEPIVLNDNQMGDGSDNWIGLHSLGKI